MQKRTIWKGFFVLEGLDGSGTSTQLQLIAGEYRRRNIPALATWEPSDLPIGRLIRRILGHEEQVHPGALARLFAADRFDHLYHGERGIRAALDRGFQVVCDRYLFSSLAYQSPALGYQETLGLNDFPLPEKLFFFDVPPELCALRRAGRERQELFDPPEIQVEVAKNYRMILADFAGLGMEIHRIDGSPPREEVFEGLKALLFPPDQPIEG